MKKRRPKKRSETHSTYVRKTRQIEKAKLERTTGSSKTPSQPHGKPLYHENPRLSQGQRDLSYALNQASSPARYSVSESHYARLSRFYVATQRLLDAQSSEELFEIIHEIVASLIGCEEFGIFRLDQHGTLSLVSSCGIDTEKLQRIPLGSSLIGMISLKGEPYLGGASSPGYRLPQESHLSACIPLKRNGQLFGAIGIFRLLPQKAALQPDDKDLLCLLGRLAAIMLLCNATFCHTVTIGAQA